VPRKVKVREPGMRVLQFRTEIEGLAGIIVVRNFLDPRDCPRT